MGLSCQEVQDLLPSYIDDMTSAEETKAIQSHLASCGVCAAEETVLRNTIAITCDLPQLAVSDAFRAKLHDRLLEETKEKSRPLKRKSVFMQYASGLAAAAAVVALSVVTFSNLPMLNDVQNAKQLVGEEAQQDDRVQDAKAPQSRSAAKHDNAGQTLVAPVSDDAQTEETTPAQAAFSHEETTEPATGCAVDAELVESGPQSYQKEFYFYLTEAGTKEAEALLAGYVNTENLILVPEEKMEEILGLLQGLDGYDSHQIGIDAAAGSGGEEEEQCPRMVRIILEKAD